MNGAAPPVVVAEHLVRRLDNEVVPVTLVHDVSLTIGRGEFVCIMGPSGSGKSSLLYLLGLLDVPTSGSLRIDGTETAGLSDDAITALRLAKLGFVFQFHFLLAEFSALDNVMLPMHKRGRWPRDECEARALALLDRFELKLHARKLPSQLSGGQRQRVAIARALANDPLLILADEPTGNLDSATSANVREILRGLAHDLDKTVIAVTHDARFAASADRRIAIVDGRIDAHWQPV